MTELEQVESEITDTKARILRSWCELGGLNLSAQKLAAEIANIEADNRFLAVLLTRREELRLSSLSEHPH